MDKIKSLKRLIFSMITLLVIFAIFELLFYVAGKQLQKQWGMWKVPVAPTQAKIKLSYQEYLQHRDPLLGWPYPLQYGKDLDTNGAQRNPFFPNGPQGNTCISLYGDSFTEGGDVSTPKNNWGNLLSKEFNCYVANFGMGGYGTDQAFLRFENNLGDLSSIVILGIHPADAIRNLTRIRDLENYQKWYALKPRFIIDSDKLKLIPIPTLSEDEYLSVLTELTPQHVLQHENLHPGGPAGVVKLEFPFTFAVLKNLINFYGFKSRLFRHPDYMEFLEPDHPLQALQIIVEITREFVELAEQRQQTPLIIILPGLDEFEYFLRKGHWSYRQIVQSYKRSNVSFIDFGPFLVSEINRNSGTLGDYFGTTGHYNDQGNALLARFVSQHLKHNIKSTLNF